MRWFILGRLVLLGVFSFINRRSGGFDSMRMTVVCAVLETAMDTYHGRRDTPCV